MQASGKKDSGIESRFEAVLPRKQAIARRVAAAAYPVHCCVICGLQIPTCITVAHLDHDRGHNEPTRRPKRWPVKPIPCTRRPPASTPGVAPVAAAVASALRRSSIAYSNQLPGRHRRYKAVLSNSFRAGLCNLPSRLVTRTTVLCRRASRAAPNPPARCKSNRTWGSWVINRERVRGRA